MSDVTNNTQNVSNAAPSPQVTVEGSATKVAPAQTPSPAQQTALQLQLDRNKALRSREQAIKASEAQVRELQDLKDLLQKNPLEALQRVGVTYDDITRRVGAGERPDPIAPVLSRVEQLEAELKARDERDAHQLQQTILAEERNKVRDLVGRSDAYPALKAAEANDAVYEYIYSNYQATGDWMDWSLAAQQLNDNLITLAKKLAPLAGQNVSAQPQTGDTVDTLSRDMRSPPPAASAPVPNQVTDIGALKKQWTLEAAKLLRNKE